jgi:hypothetical protein
MILSAHMLLLIKALLVFLVYRGSEFLVCSAFGVMSRNEIASNLWDVPVLLILGPHLMLSLYLLLFFNHENNTCSF